MIGKQLALQTRLVFWTMVEGGLCTNKDYSGSLAVAGFVIDAYVQSI